MDVSFILSTDELFTLISKVNNQTQAGCVFLKTALAGAQESDLSMLAEKNLARIDGEELILCKCWSMRFPMQTEPSTMASSGR
jgi:hypothetical protein